MERASPQSAVNFSDGLWNFRNSDISGQPFCQKALKRKQAVTAQIDFLPKLSEQEIEQLFGSRFREYAHGKTADEAMVGLLTIN